MNVDETNYSLLFDDFKESIGRCDFYAVDQEMTGVNCIDRPQLWRMPLGELYRVSREAVNRYVAFQFGIALFTLVSERVYEVKAYNFYLRKSSGDFTASASAIQFLGSHHMDFQRWLVNGMPYCDKNEEDRLHAVGLTPEYSDVEQKIAHHLVKRVENWYHASSGASQQTTVLETILTQKVEILALSMLKERDIFVLFEYERQSEVYTHPSSATVRRVTREELEKYMSGSQVHTSFNLQKALGFREFWKCLTECKKPLIGHNFWLDVMFMLHMHESPLSAVYEEYKEAVHRLFPSVYDTKTLSAMIKLPNARGIPSLQELFMLCCKLNKSAKKRLTFVFSPGHHHYDSKTLKNKGKAHEAGYDAYMTGVAFAIIKDVYGDTGGVELTRWENVISVYGSHFFMTLKGEDFIRNKATFSVQFDREIDECLVRTLLSTKKTAECLESNGNPDLSDYHLSFNDGGKCGKAIILSFQDEATTEEVIKARVEESTKRLHAWMRAAVPEEEILIPQVQKIARFTS